MKSLKIPDELHSEMKLEAAKDKTAIQDYIIEAISYWNKNRWKHRNWRSYGT